MSSFLYYQDFDILDDMQKQLYSQDMASFGGIAPTYHIELLDRPTIVWDFHSLLLGVQMMFSFMITDEKSTLKVCRHCGKAFVANRPNSVFCGASPFDQEAYEAVVARNMKGALGGIPCFYCRGTWNEDEMTFRDRTLCRMLQKAVAKQNPEEYEPWQKALMCAVGQNCDWTDKAYLNPLLNYIGISKPFQDFIPRRAIWVSIHSTVLLTRQKHTFSGLEKMPGY